MSGGQAVHGRWEALSINPQTREIFVRGRRVPLTSRQFALVSLLDTRRGVTLTHREIYQRIWGGADYDPSRDKDVVQNLVFQLRRKVEDDPKHPVLIQTVEGIGYHLVSRPVESATSLLLRPPRLIGREQECVTVAAMLQRQELRLVTLLGPPGVGKTSLALQVADDLRPEFADGVTCVALESLYDPAFVLGLIASKLVAPQAPMQPALDALVAHIRDRRMLLVLDNLEHLRPATPLLASLLAECSHLCILVTSRVALQAPLAQEYHVSPLTLPDVTARTRLPPLDALGHVPAIELFVERAQAVRSDFVLSEVNAPSVVDICLRLEGLPLAIELAAAHVRLLSPQALQAQLEPRLPMLAVRTSAAHRPARHDTLREAIRWSYELLAEEEQTLFRHLAVFRGGCTPRAVEAVCGAGANASEAAGSVELLQRLESLVAQSMVQAVGGPDGEPRVRLLETIREYALEQLQTSGELPAVRPRHAAYFLALAEEAEPQLTGSRQVEWLNRLEAEHGNLRAALEWAVESGNSDLGLRLGGALWRFWLIHGHVNEGQQRLNAVLALGDGSAAARAKVLNGAGNLARVRGDLDRARAFHEECLTVRRSLGEPREIAGSLNNLANAVSEQGDYARAGSLFEEALSLYQSVGDDRAVAILLNNLGVLARDQGDFARAAVLLEEAITRRRTLHDQVGTAIALRNLAEVMRQCGNCGRAMELAQDGLALFRELGHKQGIANLLTELGNIAEMQDDLGRMIRLFAAAASLREAIGVVIPSGERDAYLSALDAARFALGPVAFDAAWQRGWDAPVEEAIAYALEAGSLRSAMDAAGGS